ncbi:MAG: hypothetical protein KF725_12895 [Cyclobacteriaceae bacterium]|nr:hypothetical protein [Cyclobacteriaceae bacterium]UYN85474.1 MAG: hypothetical protein KIT51_11320 [Cyclobacteriaceae bacterium]
MNKTISKIFFTMLGMVCLTVVLTIQSCSDDPDPVFGQPAISIQGDPLVLLKPGATISVTLNLDAEGGNGKLVVNRNGAFLEEVVLVSTATTFTYNTQTVPATLLEGDEIAYQFVLVNTQQLESAPVSFTVSVASYDQVTVGTTPLYKIEAPSDNIIPEGQTVKLSRNREYFLDASIQFATGSTFTVEEGVKLYINTAGTDKRSINVLGQVNIQGTATNPVVFTSDKVLQAGATPAAGDWIQFRIQGTGPGSNSGTVRYLRIEYSGSDRGFRLVNVGSGTSISYVQVYKSTTEGFMPTNGDVNLSYVICTDCNGGAFRFGDNYTGNVQFAIAVSTTRTTTDADELTIRETATPKIANVTLVGPGADYGVNVHGIRFRSTSQGKVYNSIVTAYPRRGVRLNENVVTTDINGPTVFAHSYSFDVATEPYRDDRAGGTNPFRGSIVDDVFVNPYFNNVTGLDGTTPILTTIAGIGKNDFIPNAETTSVFNPSTLGSFFVSAPFVGAIKDNNTASDWTRGWVKNIDGTIR